MSKLVTSLFFLIVIFGLVVLASAGIVEGQKRFGDSYYYIKHQLVYGVGFGLLVFWICSRISFRRWKTLALPLLICAIGLLMLVFIPDFGVGVRGAQRWVHLGVITVQPSEFLKFSLIVYLAAWFARRASGKVSAAQLIPFFLILGFVGILLMLQPDFGTLGIILLIGLAMYFFSGARWRHIIILMLVIGILGGGFALAAPYRFDRIKTFFNPSEDTQGISYHINQALISIGSGGLFGLGYGQSKQKFNYLPEPVGDSIFAILAEELGFVGAMALLGLYIAFLIALVRVAQKTNDPFARLFALGVAVWIGGQAFINVAAISGLMPLTGVPLPLMSYGSSSLVSIMAAMGIVKNVAQV